jgi:hypothetical protein
MTPGQKVLQVVVGALGIVLILLAIYFLMAMEISD